MALSSTPVSTRAKLNALIALPPSRCADVVADVVVGDQAHGERLALELLIEAFLEQRDGVGLLLPDLLPFVDRGDGEMRLLCEAVVQLVAVLYQSHCAPEVEVERLVVDAHAVERDPRFQVRLDLLDRAVGRHRWRHGFVSAHDQLRADESGEPNDHYRSRYIAPARKPDGADRCHHRQHSGDSEPNLVCRNNLDWS